MRLNPKSVHVRSIAACFQIAWARHALDRARPRSTSRVRKPKSCTCEIHSRMLADRMGAPCPGPRQAAQQAARVGARACARRCAGRRDGHCRSRHTRARGRAPGWRRHRAAGAGVSAAATACCCVQVVCCLCKVCRCQAMRWAPTYRGSSGLLRACGRAPWPAAGEHAAAAGAPAREGWRCCYS